MFGAPNRKPAGTDRPPESGVERRNRDRRYVHCTDFITVNRDLDAFRQCPDCGLVQRLCGTAEGESLVCGRCNGFLARTRRLSIPFSAACAGAGLLLLLLAASLPLASVSLELGRYVQTNLTSSFVRLQQTGASDLSLIVALTLLVFPALKFASVLAMALAAHRGHASRLVKRAFVAVPWITSWAMVDVFLLGATIALLRLDVWGQVGLNLAFFALVGAAVCSLAIDGCLDQRRFWRAIRTTAPQDLTLPPIGCRHCGALICAKHDERCPRCELLLADRTHDSINRSWAMVIAAAVLFIPANVLPVMGITKLGEGGPSTILGGVMELTEREMYGLALLVFVASIVVPVFKLGVLATLLTMTARSSKAGLVMRTKLHRFVSLVGRWSMLDIFATMTLVALARFGWLGNVVPGAGASAFCAVVLTTMLASEAFDSRLMWDAAGQNSHHFHQPQRAGWVPEGALE